MARKTKAAAPAAAAPAKRGRKPKTVTPGKHVVTKKVAGINIKVPKGKRSAEQKKENKKAVQARKHDPAARNAQKLAYRKAKKKPGFKRTQFMRHMIHKLTHGGTRKDPKTGKVVKFSPMKPEAAAKQAAALWKRTW